MTYTYDPESRILTSVAYEPNGELKQSWEYKYDSKGQIIEEITKSFWHVSTTVYAYEYDSRGNCTKRIETKDYRPVRAPGDTSSEPMKTVVLREITYF